MHDWRAELPRRLRPDHHSTVERATNPPFGPLFFQDQNECFFKYGVSKKAVSFPLLPFQVGVKFFLLKNLLHLKLLP